LDQDKGRHRSYSGAQPRQKQLRGAMVYKLVQVAVTLMLLAVTFSGCKKKGAGQKKINKALDVVNEKDWCDKDLRNALGEPPRDFIKKMRKAFAEDAGKAEKEYGKKEDVNKAFKKITEEWNKKLKNKLPPWTDIKERTTKQEKGKDKGKGKTTADEGGAAADKGHHGAHAVADGGKNACEDHFKENEDESESEDDALPVSTTVSSEAEDHFKENESEAEDDALPVSTTVSSEAGAPKPPSLNAVHLRIGN